MPCINKSYSWHHARVDESGSCAMMKASRGGVVSPWVGVRGVRVRRTTVARARHQSKGPVERCISLPCAAAAAAAFTLCDHAATMVALRSPTATTTVVSQGELGLLVFGPSARQPVFFIKILFFVRAALFL